MWFGRTYAMQQWPDPEPGIPLTPVRRTAEHDLAGGGRTVDVIGRPRREITLKWSGLAPADTAMIEAYADGSAGPGPFFVVLDGAPAWNFLHPLLASAGSITGDAAGWSFDPGTTLGVVNSPVLRGPTALRWGVPAAVERWLYPDGYQATQAVPLGGTGAYTFTFNARTLAGSATVFAQLFGSDFTDGPDTVVTAAGWTQVTVTHTPADPGGELTPFIGTRAGPAADIIIDTPRLTAGTTVQPWTPGRGVPLVAIVDASISARWSDAYDVTLTLREVN